MGEGSETQVGRDHGVADWPSADAGPRVDMPDRLPDGRPWPRLRVLTPALPDTDLAATIASVSGQGYPDLVHDVFEPGGIPEVAPDDATEAYLLWLASGQLLAPGALAALCMEAALSGADAVAGLRVLFDRGVHALDILTLDDPGSASPGGDLLLSRQAVVRLGGLDRHAPNPVAALWPDFAGRGFRLARIGRPVLLKPDPGGAERQADAPSLSVASLTDFGYRGGAGIAHRRLTEALALSGHRITHLRLGDESPAAAAEWTRDFPATEATILGGGHDLVLAGNLHGATRDPGGLFNRLGTTVPVAAVMHDLFTLTGRCAHPKSCHVIATGCDARCPSPTEYPQLAPDRIAAAFESKRAALSTRHAPFLLANSDWTEDRARMLAPDAAVARITLAFPTGVFRPRGRAALRRELGLPPDDVLILFAAVIADAPDKGFDDLVATMARVARPGVGFVAIGRLDDPKRFGLANLHAPGPIGDEERLAKWYAACDLYLTASRIETLGQTPIEAGLCGTPTIAYRATGLTSAVLDEVTGILVEPRPGALAEALEALIVDAPRRRRLGATARIVLESRFSHASAAISLEAAFADRAAMPFRKAGARLRFSCEMLRRFAMARDRHPGAAGLVDPPSRPIVRSLRRAKQAVFGRGMPLWMRRALYAATLVRGNSRNPDPRP